MKYYTLNSHRHSKYSNQHGIVILSSLLQTLWYTNMVIWQIQSQRDLQINQRWSHRITWSNNLRKSPCILLKMVPSSHPYCWCFRNPANQFIGSLSLGPIIFRVSYIPGGAKFHPQYHPLATIVCKLDITSCMTPTRASIPRTNHKKRLYVPGSKLPLFPHLDNRG